MSGSGIVIIGGSGNKTAASAGIPYPVSAGDILENQDSVTREVTFTDTYMYTSDIFIPAGQSHTLTSAGAVVIQP